MSTSSFSQTQSEINEEAYKNYKKADKELNVVYQKILKDYKSDTAFLKNLKAAQKIWINFRDAEMLAKFPDREPGYYGSIQPTCWSNYLQELTEERTKRLKVWLTGIEEGNMCSGSVNIK
nr:lysozyme inhibitor LprI family protein [Flavobacterium sp.]